MRFVLSFRREREHPRVSHQPHLHIPYGGPTLVLPNEPDRLPHVTIPRLMTTFIHTADWHLGKPFASVADDEKRALVKQARMESLARLADAVKTRGAAFVVVAGDLFDSPTPSRSTVSAALSAIGALGVPVYVIPGNHDHAGPGSVWAQPYFAREHEELAPNLRVLTTPEPVAVDGAVLYPAPLEHRQLSSDPTEWLRGPETMAGAGDLPRILLAHGSIQGFSSDVDEEGLPTGQPNLISLERLPAGAFDYVALGDWHGTRQITSHAWYSGTPEPDRFPKGADHDQGGVLLVRVSRGHAPSVERLPTGTLGWHVHEHALTSPQDLAGLKNALAELLETRARKDLLRLSLDGHLSLEGRRSLDAFLESLDHRLLRLKRYDRVRLAPSEDEVRALVDSGSDPLISSVGARLIAMLEADPEGAPAAEMALRELYLATSG